MVASLSEAWHDVLSTGEGRCGGKKKSRKKNRGTAGARPPQPWCSKSDSSEAYAMDDVLDKYMLAADCTVGDYATYSPVGGADTLHPESMSAASRAKFSRSQKDRQPSDTVELGEIVGTSLSGFASADTFDDEEEEAAPPPPQAASSNIVKNEKKETFAAIMERPSRGGDNYDDDDDPVSSSSNVSANLMEMIAFLLSGILLIFMMEQFIQVGMAMRY